MFSEFKLKLERNFFENKKYSYEEYIDIGIEHLEQMASLFEKDMFACINAHTTDQLMIEEDWFPALRVDVYLSHLWTDDGLQLAFVGWLNNTFGLRCMIDSYIWGNVGRLTDEYNSLYSNHRRKANGGESFDYGSGNRVSNHINSMLHVATIKMMDKAEAVMFLNMDDEMYIYENRTLSRRYLPWVYTEIIGAKNMIKKPLDLYRKNSSEAIEVNDGFEAPGYISENELDKWEQECEQENAYPLDTLYRLLNIIA